MDPTLFAVTGVMAAAGTIDPVVEPPSQTVDAQLLITFQETRIQDAANIGLAINHKFQTRDGDKREEVVFVDCEAWGRTAEVMAEHLSKGDPVFIEGRLKLDQWGDRNTGKKRSKLKVVIENFEFVESKGSGSGQATTAGAGARSNEPIDEKDIPFG